MIVIGLRQARPLVWSIMLSRTLNILATAAAAAALLVLTWPQLFDLHNTIGIAHVVSLRGLVVAASAAVLVVLLLLALVRPLRRMVGTLAVLVVLFAAANAGILAFRGVGQPPGGAAATAAEAPSAPTGPEAITVLSWNTLGDAPGAAAIAALALAEGADVVALPETTEATGVAIAEAMRTADQPMWVHTIAFDEVSKARSTTLLISPELGDYTVSSEVGAGPPGNTNVLPTVVATPVSGDGPTIIAVHAVAPIQWEMSNWRSDLDWLATQCAGEDVIMAGDFNATIDHMAGRSSTGAAALGQCEDAAVSASAGSVGTWPTNAPALLGSPIDHVLATPNWEAERVSVIESSDNAGSDHRPIVARLVHGGDGAAG
jgi:endonuclease/exonuclease/phosphatase (EEP) superfamily protein YafD